MGFMLGNLTVPEIESRCGVAFPDDLKIFMEERHQPNASDITRGAWHCFDIPFTLLVGDMETAKTIYAFLEPVTEDFKAKLTIALAGGEG